MQSPGNTLNRSEEERQRSSVNASGAASPSDESALGSAEVQSTPTPDTQYPVKQTSLPNEIDGVNTDGRPQLDWKSKYEASAVSKIRFDAFYIALLLIIALSAIFLTWRGTTYTLMAYGCDTCSRLTFNKYAYFFLGGFLGGVLFAVKYLYKVVARHYWNMDRRLWRVFSPFLSGGLALVVGALIDSGVFGLTIKVASGAAYLSYGFITGYFADRAIDKMQEVAETVFGAPGRKDAPKAK
jgi:hypothetical protein